MKKKIALIIACILILGLSTMGINSRKKTYAKEAEMQLVIPDSVKKENEFTVKVILNSDVNLYSVDAYLSYSSDMLEYVPKNEVVTGTDGVLELKDIYGEETKTAEYELTFKALETGMADISFTDVYLIDYDDLDYITVAPSAKTFEVGINTSVEEDARLSDLIVAPGELTEEFNPNQFNYEMHVGLDVETIGISAIPMDEKSVVGLEMPERLQEGENLILVTVTAMSGNVNVYSIKVIRKEWPEELDEEDAAEEESVEIENSTETTETEKDISDEKNNTEIETDVPGGENGMEADNIVTTEENNSTEMGNTESAVTEITNKETNVE